MNTKQIDKYRVRTDLYYDRATHIWLDLSGNRAVIGMSPLVQETSGSFVAMLLAGPGTVFTKGESIGTAEAEKHVGPVKGPVSGRVLLVNEEVVRNPRLINEDPYGKGWLMEIELTDGPKEIPALITGDPAVSAWFESELKKFDEKGWTARP